ncbi:MAG: Hsp20/alpha crystallin family protein [Halobacteriales archaeon]
MRRDPDDPFDDFFREIERLMDGVMSEEGMAGRDTHVDVHEYDDRITVIADLPGVSKDEIDVTCDGETLSVTAAGESRRYDERVRLPGRVDEHSASATYNNGVLEVTFDRAEGGAGIDVE